ncbi:MAG: YicC/YloC family endoribonuclease [Candidatus Poribacteria bacterium]
MTGYGRQETNTLLGTLVIELKAWNHRYCNITVRLPTSLSRFEHQVQNAIRRRVSRGQVQATIELTPSNSDSNKQLAFDLTLAKQYHAALVQLQDALQLQDEISTSLIAQLPGVFTLQELTVEEDSTWRILESTLDETLDGLETTKCAEGSAMFEEISQRLGCIQSLVQDIQAVSGDLVQAAQAKLEARLNELFEGRIEIDQNRLVMEAGVIASRSDITEELVRLDSHCVQFEQYLQANEPVGRQLDFLLQEMNREVNTISSKASLASISSICISLKTEIEKIREIVQNVE